jgi:signal transduction histidine kinase
LLGDLCVVEFRDVANVIHHAAGHIDPPAATELRRLGCSFFDLSAVAPAVAGVMSGKGPTIIERSELAQTFGLDATDERLRCIRDVASLVILPLEGRGSIFGTLAIGSLGERFPAREDMPLAVELARRASLAIDNGRLFSELYDANAAKDRFLAMLSHELRTPLTPVLAAVSALVASGSTAGYDVIELFRMIQRNVQLEARLIDDLLDLTRLSRGKFELTFDDVDLHDLVLSVVSICESDAQNKGVTLSVETTARRSRVRGDPARLEQILWNLIKNAIKFTPKGGQVKVSTLDAADDVNVAVEDTGIGIEPERVSRIFLPFVQADPSIARSFGGMGLGLSISKALAEAHEGSICVVSDGPGRGATFTLALRALRSLESAPPSQPDANRVVRFAPPPRMPSSIAVATAHPVRVLLVEDDPDTLAVTSMLLRAGTYEVATAETISQALTHLRDHDFDLLISDISLPDGSGLDLMREVLERQKDVRGIALSGFGSQEDVRRARLAGFSVHLTKPVSFPRLETTIREITG